MRATFPGADQVTPRSLGGIDTAGIGGRWTARATLPSGVVFDLTRIRSPRDTPAWVRLGRRLSPVYSVVERRPGLAARVTLRAFSSRGEIRAVVAELTGAGAIWTRVPLAPEVEAAYREERAKVAFWTTSETAFEATGLSIVPAAPLAVAEALAAVRRAHPDAAVVVYELDGTGRYLTPTGCVTALAGTVDAGLLARAGDSVLERPAVFCVVG